RFRRESVSRPGDAPAAAEILRRSAVAADAIGDNQITGAVRTGRQRADALSYLCVDVAKQLRRFERSKCLLVIRDSSHRRPLAECAGDPGDDQIVDAPRLDGYLVALVSEDGNSDLSDMEFLAQMRNDANVAMAALWHLFRGGRLRPGRRWLCGGSGGAAQEQHQRNGNPSHAYPPRHDRVLLFNE